MPRIYVYLLALTLALCALPEAARAQDDPPQEQTGAARTAPTTYVYGNAAPVTPESLARVRRRIGKIGTQGTSRRVAYPIVIYVPPAQGVSSPTPTPSSPAAPGRSFTQADLDRLQNDLARRLDARFDDVEDRLDDLYDASRARDAAPSVVQVEGALLETGLFQTTDVIFEFDRSTLLPVSERTLDAVGDVLARHPEVRLEVAGHTDGTGPDAYNQRLSEARASAVRSYLLDRFALAPERIAARGYGESRPVASDATSTGRALNRRVEFRVLNQ